MRILQHQIMPDHVHLVVYVTERLPEKMPLGNIVASWKAACSKACAVLDSSQRDLKAAPQDNQGVSTGTLDEAAFKSPAPASLLKAAPQDNQGARAGTLGEAAFRSLSSAPLFSKGFNDSILSSRGQLEYMMAYVRDNPRRFLIKKQKHKFFIVHRGLNVAGIAFDAVGNLDLLKAPLLAVHCRRRWSERELSEYTERCIEASNHGTVLVGAFISKAEKEISLRVSKACRPLIHLMENGFPELYKPSGRAFYSCAEGRSLQLAPWPYHNTKKPISRSQCVELNRMAEMLATTK